MARGRSADYQLNRETIVRTATRLFAQQGYPGTSMSDLARECGISKPLLYHYVSDKYELLREITESHVTRLESLVGEVESLGLAPAPRLRELIRRFVHEYAQARHDHGVLTQDVKFLEAKDRNRVLRKERAVVAAFAATIAQARPELAKAALDKPLTMLLFGMINWMFTWLSPEGRLRHDDMAPIVADLFLGGLGAVNPPPVTSAASVKAPV
ncbi:TetR/AcrR family transcriptional regulator [Rhizobacter sp. AJA081-3]|jgi:TetR/AcrR family transcriptional regulator|uniref:TetR/AcrR family transcriptional regulator n=1 Tax=Rhizobacter sp. AJA081-3 TaxID=2753607 RepID=UPI001AE08268|nr:TetR/AcrR family transcriptional regulator [Rhizobacter sp. AJA081-3]QTN24891.1 TetR/AcrR family transcriptional regulator [Rhizobacter sp. AJA081-3]